MYFPLLLLLFNAIPLFTAQISALPAAAPVPNQHPPSPLYREPDPRPQEHLHDYGFRLRCAIENYPCSSSDEKPSLEQLKKWDDNVRKRKKDPIMEIRLKPARAAEQAARELYEGKRKPGQKPRWRAPWELFDLGEEYEFGRGMLAEPEPLDEYKHFYSRPDP